MKRFVWIALMLAPAALPAQRLESLGGGVGLLRPTGSFGDVENAGWQASLTVAGSLKGALGFTVDAVYGRTSHKDAAGGKTTAFGVIAHAALVVGSDAWPVRPLVFAGAGPTRVAIEVPNFGTGSATKLAFDVGGGVRFGRVGFGRGGFITVSALTVKTKPDVTSFMSVRAGALFPIGRPR